jgi:hypothetical protein
MSYVLIFRKPKGHFIFYHNNNMENDINRRSCIDYIEVHIVDHDSSLGMHSMLVHRDCHIDHHCNTYNHKDFSQNKFSLDILPAQIAC